MCVDQLSLLSAKLHQARLFAVDELGLSSRRNPIYEDDVDNVWQIRFKDGARYVFQTKEDADDFARDLRQAISPVITSYRELLYAELTSCLDIANANRVEMLISWLEAMQKDPVVIIPEAVCRQIVGLDSSWVAYVEIGEEARRGRLRDGLNAALDSVMVPRIESILSEMKYALRNR